MITKYLHRPLPPDVRAAILRFAQGHLVRRPRIVFSARPDRAVTMWTAALPENVRANPDAIVAPRDRPPFGMLLDQGCDIEKPSIPLVHAAPVYNAAADLSAGECQRVRTRTAFDYFVALEPPEPLEALLTEDETVAQRSEGGDWLWVADLRLEIPLEKSVLATADPIEAFQSTERYLDLSELLANRRRRPAIPAVVDTFSEEVNAAITEHSELVEQVSELRVGCDHMVAPSHVVLYIVVEGDGNLAAARDAWNNQADRLAAHAVELGFALDYEVTTLDIMTARQLRDSARLYVV